MERKHRMRRHPLRSREILPVSGPIVIGWAGIGEDAYTAVESYPQRSWSSDLSWSRDFTPGYHCHIHSWSRGGEGAGPRASPPSVPLGVDMARGL